MHPKKANVELTLILFAEYTFDKKGLLSPQRVGPRANPT
jgi:hypothetical protein